jgi:REP element-mobilizing transposase RayT
LLTKNVRHDLFPYIGGIIRGVGGVALAVGGMPDHAHVVAALPTSVAVSDVMRTVKANSSRWMNERYANSRFGWQTGYGAFSVSRSLVSVVVEYVENQAAHHRRRSFSEEISALIDRHGVYSAAPPGLEISRCRDHRG